MKLIIAHLPTDVFEPVRAELADLGVSRMTISQVHSTSAGPTLTLRYRGALSELTLRAELRVECFADDGQSAAIINVLRGHAGTSGQVAVLELEELYHERSEEHEFLDDPRLDVAVG